MSYMVNNSKMQHAGSACCMIQLMSWCWSVFFLCLVGGEEVGVEGGRVTGDIGGALRSPVGLTRVGGRRQGERFGRAGTQLIDADRGALLLLRLETHQRSRGSYIIPFRMCCWQQRMQLQLDYCLWTWSFAAVCRGKRILQLLKLHQQH